MFALFISLACFPQETNKNNYSSRRDISVEVTNLSKIEKSLNVFLKEYNSKILTQNTTQRTMRTEFALDMAHLDLLENILEETGYITKKNYDYTDVDEMIKKIENEKERLKGDIERFKSDIERIATSDEQASTKQSQINGKQNQITEKQGLIAEKQNLIEALRQNANRSYISLYVSEDDMLGDGVIFVNMPGFEYGWLFTENPKPGLSAPYYQSYAIKFLFTRGKSYFTLAMMKAMDYDKTNDDIFSEYFLINFGQDFYTRHLGRGKRRFFNPYISYQTGGFVANNKLNENKFIFNANVAMGVEFIKTRSFLLDSKVSYFMPLHNSFVYMRGMQASIAANVLF